MISQEDFEVVTRLDNAAYEAKSQFIKDRPYLVNDTCIFQFWKSAQKIYELHIQVPPVFLYYSYSTLWYDNVPENVNS